MYELNTYIRDRSLVSIRRSEIDANAIHGYLLDASSELVLLQYVYDFNLDGLMLLRRSDLSDVVSTATDRFQDELLRSEGMRSRVPFGLRLDLSNWRNAISELSRRHGLLILECEALDESKFVIGRVLSAAPRDVSIESFTGTARWNEQQDVLSYDDITACQVDTNYINVYKRHFERGAPSS